MKVPLSFILLFLTLLLLSQTAVAGSARRAGMRMRSRQEPPPSRESLVTPPAEPLSETSHPVIDDVAPSKDEMLPNPQIQSHVETERGKQAVNEPVPYKSTPAPVQSEQQRVSTEQQQAVQSEQQQVSTEQQQEARSFARDMAEVVVTLQLQDRAVRTAADVGKTVAKLEVELDDHYRMLAHREHKLGAIANNANKLLSLLHEFRTLVDDAQTPTKL